ncbi:MAG: hypothetical protein WKF34_07100 [Pyrinomonadaceae bacterium]
MRVRDLIRKLERADPDLDVMVSPGRYYPVLELGKMPTEPKAPAYTRIADMDDRCTIEGISLIRDMQLPGEPEMIVLVYDAVRAVEASDGVAS